MRLRLRGNVLATVIAGIFALPGLGFATSISQSNERMTLGDLVRGSDTVVLGSVSAKESRWAGKQIVTEYQIEVERTLKGDEQTVRNVREPGGSVERPFPLAMIVPGVPSFESGSHVVLFLKRGADGSESVFALTQGAVAVLTEANGIKRFVVRDGHRVQLDAFLKEIDEAVRLSAPTDRR